MDPGEETQTLSRAYRMRGNPYQTYPNGRDHDQIDVRNHTRYFGIRSWKSGMKCLILLRTYPSSSPWYLHKEKMRVNQSLKLIRCWESAMLYCKEWVNMTVLLFPSHGPWLIAWSAWVIFPWVVATTFLSSSMGEFCPPTLGSEKSKTSTEICSFERPSIELSRGW